MARSLVVAALLAVVSGQYVAQYSYPTPDCSGPVIDSQVWSFACQRRNSTHWMNRARWNSTHYIQKYYSDRGCTTSPTQDLSTLNPQSFDYFRFPNLPGVCYQSNSSRVNTFFNATAGRTQIDSVWPDFWTSNKFMFYEGGMPSPPAGQLVALTSSEPLCDIDGGTITQWTANPLGCVNSYAGTSRKLNVSDGFLFLNVFNRTDCVEGDMVFSRGTYQLGCRSGFYGSGGDCIANNGFGCVRAAEVVNGATFVRVASGALSTAVGAAAWLALAVAVALASRA